MKLGFISDTHDQIDNVIKSITIFNREKVDLAFHLGDVCSPFTLKEFKKLNCRMKLILGNNDADIHDEMKSKPSNVEILGRSSEQQIDGKKIVLIHGDPEGAATLLVDSKKYDYVFRGHDHMARIEKHAKCTLINPGNMLGPIDICPHWTKPSIAIVDFKKGEEKIIYL